MQAAIKVEDITTLARAKERITLLEEKLEEAILLIVRRDEQLSATERNIRMLEDRIDELSADDDTQGE